MKLKVLTSIVAVVFLLAACNSNTSGDTDDSGAVRISATAWGDPKQQKVFEKSIEKFNKDRKGEINVDLQVIPADYDTKLTTMVAGNETPDVAQMESATLAYPLAEEGKFLDLNTFLEKDPELSIDDLAPQFGYYSDDGELIGVCPERETFMLFYNEDMFEEAGAELPPVNAADAWDWNEFVEVAKKLTIDQNGNNALSPNFNPKNIKQFGIDFGKWWGNWGNFIYSNGGDFISDDGEKFGLTEPKAVEALQKLADLINVHHVAPSPIQSKSLPGGATSLQTKKVAMMIDGQWLNYNLGNSGVKYNVGVLPKMDKPVTMVVCGMFSIFSNTDHPEESWDTLKALINPESAFDMINEGLWLPTLKDWYTDPDIVSRWTNNKFHPSGFSGAIDAILNYSVPSPTGYVRNFNKILEFVDPALDQVWLGEKTAEDALKEIEKDVEKVLEGRRDIK
ncbi:ABC transporter substrate-binding protein [Lederbergia graminis]|uniref:ABC transporter substrate-binding protein n=1 Tax=Lederbergia graminis TaxID=735518 RepID=A0ABW0LJU5_9BACI|nr:sugar ABC transporter substrate-binding protein [Bacillaceae bacterium]